jgi:SpoVK/Ycf46/Vps4 family AAA+-type ATPase
LIRIGAHDSWGSTLHSQIDTTVKVAPLSPALQLLDYQTIFPKKLFYNTDTNEKVRMLRKILIPTNFKKFENRTKKNGDYGGVISLLSGGPGTGKTELARQLALETQRDLLLFEVTEQRNMYFGETEKAIKQVFSDYRRIARQVKNAPILFFNEGDSVFAKRKENHSNTSQTENTVQTILLQELEVFTGILIITTNLPNSFDAAFDRRILLKIHIGNPNAEVRFDLIRHIFPMISIDAAKNLSLNYEFTSAQLGVFQKQWELKSIIKEIRGSQVEALEQFLASLNSTSKRRIGFVA